MVYNITNLQDLDILIKKTKNTYFLLKFSAEWCMPCKKIKQRYNELSQIYQDVIFIEIDIDNDNTNNTIPINEYFQINNLPTFILIYSNGEHLPNSNHVNNIITHRIEGIDLSSLIGILQNIKSEKLQKTNTFNLITSIDRFEPPNINFTRELGYNNDNNQQINQYYRNQGSFPNRKEDDVKSYNDDTFNNYSNF